MIFEDIKVSTQTFTVRSNILNLDLYLFYTQISPCKNKNAEILYMKYKSLFKGEEDSKKIKKKNNGGTKKNFLNCVSLVIQTNNNKSDDKKINVKTFKNGVFQLTGCKQIDHVKTCLGIIIEQLNLHPHLFTLTNDDKQFVIYIKSAMRNIDFAVDFKIDRTKLLEYINKETPYTIPTVVTANMGVKIKIPIELDELPILRIDYNDNLETVEKELLLKDCKDIIEPDPKKRLIKFEKKFISISIFQNGKILMSCVDETFQRIYFDIIFKLINKIKNIIINHDIPNKTFI